jgi:hypothetical protein
MKVNPKQAVKNIAFLGGMFLVGCFLIKIMLTVARYVFNLW